MSTLALRLSLAVIGFALGLGVVLAVRHEAADLSRAVCPDCRNSSAHPVFYKRDEETGKVSGTNANTGLLDPDPSFTAPTPLRGPKWSCPKCDAAWGPPDVLRHGRRPRR